MSATESSWIDTLTEPWLRLPTSTLVDVGAATQTLGGVLAITNNETFVTIETIAMRARLPKRTVEKHLKTLSAHGWIENQGRGKTRTGRPRRTCTIQVPAITKKCAAEYLPLPWWCTCRFRNTTPLRWSERLIVAMVLRRLMALASAGVEELGASYFDWDTYDDLGGDDRFKWSLNEIQEQTGLSRPSIIEAKASLKRRGVIKWRGSPGSKDTIAPNERLRVLSTPVENQPGRFWMDLRQAEEE